MTTLEVLAKEGRWYWEMMMKSLGGTACMYYNQEWNRINSMIRDGKYDQT